MKIHDVDHRGRNDSQWGLARCNFDSVDPRGRNDSQWGLAGCNLDENT